LSNNTTLNPGAGGDTLVTEDLGGGVKIEAVKIHTGSTGSDGGPATTANPIPTSTVVRDGVTAANLVSVGAFHNTDNQTLPGSGFAILTAGVAQFLNPTGTSDRQRATGVDGISAVGVSTGSAQFAQAILTSVTAAVGSTGSQAVTPIAMTGIQVGSILTIDTVASAKQENVFVTAVTATTFTANFTQTHTGGFPVAGFIYNQERDASGELDGASGKGTAVAAEYEYNAGSPGGGFFDRARNVQGKGVTTVTITSGGGATSTSVVLSAVVGLQPGVPLYFQGGTAEVAYVSINYVPGATTVPLQSALVNTHANSSNVAYDSYAFNGPQLNGILPTGIGLEEDVVYDPISNLFYLERSATADGVSGQGLPMENPGVFNGTTMDRQRSQSAANTTTMLTPSPMTGIEMCSSPAGWVKNSAPAAATQATVTLAAGAAGVRHVCTSITASVATGATAQTPINVYLRDGATGAGAVLWAGCAAAPVNGSCVIAVPMVAIPGTAATAMTVEFSAAGVAASLEAVTMTGYDIS
jgi:hypothetical protein